MTDVKIRPAQPGEAEAFMREQMPTSTLDWKLVGMTWRAWFDAVGGWPTEQGTLLHTERGVYMCGLCGTLYLGRKRDDGAIDDAGFDMSRHDFSRDTDVILEYADSPGCGYTRDERGAIVLPPGSDEDW